MTFFIGFLCCSYVLKCIYICLQDLGGSDHFIDATEIDNISAPLHRQAVLAEILQRLSAVAESVVFADKYSHSVVADIDILIGMDTYWRFIYRTL